MKKSATDFSSDVLAADEQAALLVGMTTEDIDAAREQAKAQHGMTLEQAIEAHASRPGGLIDRLSAIYGLRINHLTAKDMAQVCLLADGLEHKPPAARLDAYYELKKIIEPKV